MGFDLVFQERHGVEGWEEYTPYVGLSSLSVICSRATQVTLSHCIIRNETASKAERFYLSPKAKKSFSAGSPLLHLDRQKEIMTLK